MVAGCAVLVLLLRQSLLDGLETSAEQRAAALAAQIEQDGLPASIGAGDADRDEAADHEDPDDPEDVVLLVRGPDGAVVLASQPVARLLPDAAATVRMPGSPDDGRGGK